MRNGMLSFIPYNEESLCVFVLASLKLYSHHMLGFVWICWSVMNSEEI